MLDFLEQEQISKELLEGIREYRNAYPTPPELQNRIPKPRYHYYGKEVWEASIAAPPVRRKSAAGRQQGYG